MPIIVVISAFCASAYTISSVKSVQTMNLSAEQCVVYPGTPHSLVGLVQNVASTRKVIQALLNAESGCLKVVCDAPHFQIRSLKRPDLCLKMFRISQGTCMVSLATRTSCCGNVWMDQNPFNHTKPMIHYLQRSFASIVYWTWNHVPRVFGDDIHKSPSSFLGLKIRFWIGFFHPDPDQMWFPADHGWLTT